MAIERDAGPKFHELGTLMSLTKWIRTHDEGLAEWLKNVRRAYQSDRANVCYSGRRNSLEYLAGPGGVRAGFRSIGGRNSRKWRKGLHV